MNNNMLNKLGENDIYNIILYAIYKLTGNPEYSTISELIYSLDKDSLLNLCATFGGCTIRIPTLEDLRLFTNTLLIYQKINFEGYSFQAAFDATNLDPSYKRDVIKIYSVMSEILSDYE